MGFELLQATCLFSKMFIVNTQVAKSALMGPSACHPQGLRVFVKGLRVFAKGLRVFAKGLRVFCTRYQNFFSKIHIFLEKTDLGNI